ncbi:hypothetical protein C8N47_101283 [Mangrovibacterium marinum]|uniref:Uncharacterized protein n=1 Tax=Mangrovibacterium marinum TaxID=1639118 RepID=A0A2T5C6Q0_9BACT|nr:hypothetical protein C8N47_101283 [Mangrovibacterium marinum]
MWNDNPTTCDNHDNGKSEARMYTKQILPSRTGRNFALSPFSYPNCIPPGLQGAFRLISAS